MYESVEELAKQRKGYKYLNKDRTSPYQYYKYDFRKKTFKTGNLDTDTSSECGAGWSLATLDWILNDTNVIDKIIVEFSIPEEAKIIIPKNSSGKFRTDIIKYEKVHSLKNIFPEVYDLLNRCKKYKPINPITATQLPPEKDVKKILKKVRNQVRNQVRDQVGNQVRDQVGDQVRDQVWDQVRDQVGDQVRDQVGDQVRNQVRDQVWNQVWDQVCTISYWAVKKFCNLKYEHPVFDLIRMGVIVVHLNGKIKIYGKNGKFLGEYDE